MRPTLRIKIPALSTMIFFVVLLTVIPFPDTGGFRGVLFYALGGYMLIRMFLSRGNIRWGHLLWALGFYALGALSRYWAVYPNPVIWLSGSLLFAMILNWSVGEYIYQGQYELDHICRIMLIMAVLLAANFLMNSTVRDGRYSLNVNENIFGISAAYLFGFLMYAAKKAKWRKIFIDVMLVVLLLIILLTGSRKALLMAALFVVAFFLFWSPEKGSTDTVIRIIGLTAACIAAILLVMNVEVLYNAVGNRLESLYRQWILGEDVDGSAITRNNMIAIGLELFLSMNPIFGLGLNNFKYLSGYWTYSHNNYIELLCSLGIVGILVFYVPLIYFTVQAFLLWRKRVPGAILPLTILVLQFVNDWGQVSYYSFQINIFLGIAIGYVYVMEKRQREKEAMLEREREQREFELAVAEDRKVSKA